MTKPVSGLDRERLQAAEPRRRRGWPAPRAARSPATASAIAAMCSGVVPQQPPTPFTSPLSANSREQLRSRLGRLVVAAERVRQAGVRVAPDGHVGDARQLGQPRAHLGRAERAVDRRPRAGSACSIEVQNASTVWPDSVRPLRSTTVSETTSGSCGRDILGGHDRGLRVQRVEDRLDQQQVDAALGERLGSARRTRRAPRRRWPRGSAGSSTRADIDSVTFSGPTEPGHEPRPLGVEPRRTPAARAARPRRSSRRRRPRARSRPGRSRVAVNVFVVVMSAPAARYGAVDVRDDVRPGQVEQIGIAGDVLRVVGEPLAPVVLRRRARRAWSIVPQAPSSTTIRSSISACRADTRSHSPLPSGRTSTSRPGAERGWPHGLFRRFFPWSPSRLKALQA